MDFFTSNLFMSLLIYIFSVASPGPSNLAISYTSIYAGRKSALYFASGIVIGSFFWGVLAASGLQPLLSKYSEFLYLLKIFGGLYFLYLAYNSFKMVIKKEYKKRINKKEKQTSNLKYFISGIMMHLLNPKAIAVWIAVIAVALPSSVSDTAVYVPVVLCLPFGVIIFIGYAFLFSNEKVVNKYFTFKKYIDSFVGTAFSIVGLKLIFEGNK